MSNQRYSFEGAGEPLPSGHRIFTAHTDDGIRYAIADNSGRTPSTTDDGVLFLDPTRCLNASTRHAPTVPLVSPAGEKSSTPVDTPTILFLSRRFGWTIADEPRGRFFNVQ